MDYNVIVFLNYLFDILKITFYELFIILGPLIILAFIMHFVAKAASNIGVKVFGWRTHVYFFKIIGTPVHELGHAIFAILFGHKIVEMKLFAPHSDDGSMGYVDHTYNTYNVYHRIGNFFIGIGPILLGSILLYIFSYALFKFNIGETTSNITQETFTSFTSFRLTINTIWLDLLSYLQLIFFSKDSSWWKIVLWFYILFSIGSSVSLSMSDIKGAFSGFVFFTFILFLFNLITYWISDSSVHYIHSISQYFSGFYFLLFLSIIVNILFIIFLFFVDKMVVLIKRNR